MTHSHGWRERLPDFFGTPDEWQSRYESYKYFLEHYADEVYEAEARGEPVKSFTLYHLEMANETAEQNARGARRISDALYGLQLERAKTNPKAQVKLPPYITRAIGERPDILADPWMVTCGSIEVFRQLRQLDRPDPLESRPDLILGPAAAAPWLEAARQENIRSIVRLQLAEIMLSPDPMETAEKFGQTLLIEEFTPTMPEGMAPEAVAEQYATPGEPRLWLNEAVRIYEETWPLSGLLATDTI